MLPSHSLPASARPSRTGLALLTALSLLASLVPARAQWLTLANPDWNITLTDYGYSDFLLDNTPGFQGREYLSGEWGAAIGYQLAGQPALAPQWLEPQFVYPDWLTGSPFHVVTPLTATGLNADNLPIAQSVIENGDVRITLRFEMLDTVVGTPMGTTPASAADAPTSIPSDRYVLQQSVTVQNISGQPLAQLQLFQFLHGLHSQRGLYDNRAETGALAEYQYDTTLAGVDLSAVGPGSSADGLEDFIGFHARVAPTALEVGHYGIEGNGIDDHWSGKPSDGVHRSIEDNWQTPPYNTREGTDVFLPAQRWVAGAQRWDLGSLGPGQSASLDVLLSIRTGTRVVPGTHLTGGCNGGSSVPGGLDYDFNEVTSEGACFGKYTQADASEIAIRVAAGEISPVDFLTPGGPVQLWEVALSGSFTGPVQLTFAYDPTILPGSLDPLELDVYQDDGGTWQPLAGTVDPVTHTITVQVTSLTPFALGVGGTAVTHTISTAVSPAGAGTVSGSGTFAAGAQATVTASAAAGYVFVDWTEAGATIAGSPSYSFTVTGDRSLTANFAAVTGGYAISTSSLPANGGTTAGDGSYLDGASATVVATPAPGYKFSKWLENGAVVSTAAAYTFNVGQDRALTAKFKPVYSLNLTVDPDGAGEVEGDPFYELGELAKLKAKPNSGYAFVGWFQNELLVSDDPNFQFNMTGNKELIGRFAEGFRVDTSSVPPHAGTTMGGGVHPAGTSVTLEAIPTPGYVFLYWADVNAPEIALSTASAYTYTPATSEALVAQFALGPEIAVEQPAGVDLVNGLAALDFGATRVGSAGATLTLTIRNLGPQPLSIHGVGVVAGDIADFVVNAAATLASVPANDSTTVDVTFNPVALGIRAATLEILSDDADESSFLISLGGTGESPPPTAARLASFRAVATGPNLVSLNWESLVESRTLAYSVERQTGPTTWEAVAGSPLPAVGSASRPHTYSLTERPSAIVPGTAYRLVEIDLAGTRTVLASCRLSVPLAALMEAFAGKVRLQITASPTGLAVIESAPSLAGPWEPCASVTCDGTGPGVFVIPTAQAAAQQFFRAFAQ